MTSASACRPRLVGRPRGIMPAPTATASGVRACWGLLADLQGHEPCSTTAGSAPLSLGFIDGRAAASSPSSFRPANENARTITPRENSRGARARPSRDHRAHELPPPSPRELQVASRGTPFASAASLDVASPCSFSRDHSNSRGDPPIVRQSYSRTVTGAYTRHVITHRISRIRFASRIPASLVRADDRAIETTTRDEGSAPARRRSD